MFFRSSLSCKLQKGWWGKEPECNRGECSAVSILLIYIMPRQSCQKM